MSPMICGTSRFAALLKTRQTVPATRLPELGSGEAEDAPERRGAEGRLGRGRHSGAGVAAPRRGSKQGGGPSHFFAAHARAQHEGADQILLGVAAVGPPQGEVAAKLPERGPRPAQSIRRRAPARAARRPPRDPGSPPIATPRNRARPREARHRVEPRAGRGRPAGAPSRARSSSARRKRSVPATAPMDSSR